jgi:hypothetical protein
MDKSNLVSDEFILKNVKKLGIDFDFKMLYSVRENLEGHRWVLFD